MPYTPQTGKEIGVGSVWESVLSNILVKVINYEEEVNARAFYRTVAALFLKGCLYGNHL